MGFDPSALVVTAIVLAVGALLLLTVFSNKLPAKVRATLEKALGIGYPTVVGVCFGALAWRAYSNDETGNAVGFLLGGAFMVFMAVRSARRGMRRR